MGELIEGDAAGPIADLEAMGLITNKQRERLGQMLVYRHGTVAPVLRGKVEKPIVATFGRVGERLLTVTASRERYEIETAHAQFFGIREWARATVSVYGALWARIIDQRLIGRQRGPGERSPAPLPDWYELNHLVYEHGHELGFDPDFPVYQYLPSRLEPYLNIAEALHLRQPK